MSVFIHAARKDQTQREITPLLVRLSLGANLGSSRIGFLERVQTSRTVGLLGAASPPVGKVERAGGSMYGAAPRCTN